MKLPAITGLIRRRILLNYRVAPDAIEKVLPANFTPKLLHGKAIAGICLIRLEQIRPKGMPALTGISSENSAHRIAVEWQDETGQHREGVFIPRRDTNSRVNAIAGGRVFPGVHHHSAFHVRDQGGKISIRVASDDYDSPLVDLTADESETFPETSVFESLEESSRFFEGGCIGYSSRPDATCLLDGLMLKIEKWRVTPLHVGDIHSAYFDDRSRFPAEAIAFDHALLMRDVVHEWRSERSISAQPRT